MVHSSLLGTIVAGGMMELGVETTVGAVNGTK